MRDIGEGPGAGLLSPGRMNFHVACNNRVFALHMHPSSPVHSVVWCSVVCVPCPSIKNGRTSWGKEKMDAQKRFFSSEPSEPRLAARFARFLRDYGLGRGGRLSVSTC